MKKLLIISVLSLSSLVFIVISGDYYGLWGQITINKMEIENIHFRASDAVSGGPVINYHIRCSGHGSNDICSTGKYETNAVGEKTIKIGVYRKYLKGLIFKHPVANELDLITDLRLWVLHPDYETITIEMSSEELLQFRQQAKLLTLNPKVFETTDS